MVRMRRKHSAEFKLKAVMEILKGEKTAAVSDYATRLELLKIRDEDAFGCLIFLSYLAAENISEFWLQTLLVEQYEISLAEAMSRARLILKLLEQFQFITYNEKASILGTSIITVGAFMTVLDSLNNHIKKNSTVRPK